jgi:hypothetical protein
MELRARNTCIRKCWRLFKNSFLIPCATKMAKAEAHDRFVSFRESAKGAWRPMGRKLTEKMKECVRHPGFPAIRFCQPVAVCPSERPRGICGTRGSWECGTTWEEGPQRARRIARPTTARALTLRTLYSPPNRIRKGTVACHVPHRQPRPFPVFRFCSPLERCMSELSRFFQRNCFVVYR